MNSSESWDNIETSCLQAAFERTRNRFHSLLEGELFVPEPGVFLLRFLPGNLQNGPGSPPGP